jgi:hypothetical protein
LFALFSGQIHGKSPWISDDLERTPLGVLAKSEFHKVGGLQGQLAARIIRTVHASALVKAFV